MLPHGNADKGTGLPTVVCHCTCPLRRSSEYSVSASVATSTRSPTTSGSAYTAPSSRVLQALVSRAGSARPAR